MIIMDLMKVSIQNIWSHKLRSGLTMLGLIIGIMAVVLITTLGNGAKADMQIAFQQRGEGKMSVSVQSTVDEQAVYRDYFNQADVEGLSSIYEIQATSPQITRRIQAKNQNVSVAFYLMGVNSNFNLVENIDLLEGRFLSDEDVKGRRNVTVIDEKVAASLFGSTDCLGEVFTVTSGYQTIELMVIGIVKLSDSTLMNLANGTYYYGYAPLTVVSRMYSIDRYPRILIQAQELADMQQVGSSVLNLLMRRNKDPEKVNVYIRETEFSQINAGIRILTGTIAAIAGISLVVGGIGIMNMMLVSVTERTREIGIRKAIGAKSYMILIQFLFESVILSVIGGLIGLGLGVGLGWVIVGFLSLPFILSVHGILLAFFFSVGIGIFFGVYPARKAAQLDPIEALRYE